MTWGPRRVSQDLLDPKWTDLRKDSRGAGPGTGRISRSRAPGPGVGVGGWEGRGYYRPSLQMRRLTGQDWSESPLTRAPDPPEPLTQCPNAEGPPAHPSRSPPSYLRAGVSQVVLSLLPAIGGPASSPRQRCRTSASLPPAPALQLLLLPWTWLHPRIRASERGSVHGSQG